MRSNNGCTTELTIENFKDLLKQYYFEFGTDDGHEELLTSILKADIGGVLDKTNPNPEQIQLALYHITAMFKLIRTLTPYANSSFLIQNPSCRAIISLVQTINENDIEGDVMGSLGMWIFNDREESIILSYALELSKNFKIMITFLKECYQVGVELYQIEMKGGLSCV